MASATITVPDPKVAYLITAMRAQLSEAGDEGLGDLVFFKTAIIRHLKAVCAAHYVLVDGLAAAEVSEAAVEAELAGIS